MSCWRFQALYKIREPFTILPFNSTATVSTERGGTARHWCFPTWSYHSGAETAPLVACETENWFQIGGACLQVTAWSCSAVPVGRLSTRHGRGTSTSQVFRRLHVFRPTDTVTDRRQEFLCSRTAAMEQPTDRDPQSYSVTSRTIVIKYPRFMKLSR